MKALITINGLELPTPSEYSGTTSTIVDSARNAQGYVVGSVIREDVAKIVCKWGYIDATTWSNILKKFNTTYGGSFYNDCEFYNQVTNSWETRKFYVADRSAPAFKVDQITGAITGYTGVSLSLIEV